MHIGDKIKKRRIELNMSQEELAKRLGYSSRSTINKIEKGINDITQSKIIEFAKALDTTISYLMDWEDLSTPLNTTPVHFMEIPLYGDISCGNGMFIEDNILDTIKVVSNGLSGAEEDYFAQTASGNSMINAGVEDGDILIFRKSSTIDNGQIGSFCIDDGIATCKKFKQGETFIQLIPMNPDYDPIVIDINNVNFRVVGILKMAIKKFF